MSVHMGADVVLVLSKFGYKNGVWLAAAIALPYFAFGF